MSLFNTIRGWFRRRPMKPAEAIPPLPPPRDGFWPRFVATPLTDLLRGRMSARLDLRRLISQAQLPEPLAGLTYEKARRVVVGDYRRIALARNWIEHFRAGLAAGQSPLALAERVLTWEQATGRVRSLPPAGMAELPSDVVGTIARVLHRARLWPRERADVAAELAAHFRDGLSAGQTSAELLAHFGDWRDAARLIRRAKLRNRPLACRAFRLACQATAAAVAALVFAYCCLVVRFFATSPTIRHNYISDVNADAREVPPEEQAWPLYRAALMKLPKERPSAEEYAAGPAGEHWPAVLAFLDANREALELARQASEKPHLGFIYGDPRNREFLARYAGRADAHGESPDRYQPEVIAVVLPQAQEMRALFDMFEADARQAAANGDGATVRADVEAILRLAAHVRETFPGLIVELIATAFHKGATRTVLQTLADEPDLLSDGDLKLLAHAFAAYGAEGHFKLRIDGERMIIDDLLQRIFTDDGHGDGYLTAEGVKALHIYDINVSAEKAWLWGPVASAAVAGRREVHDLAAHWFDRWQAERRLPLWQWQQSSVETEIKAMPHFPARYRLFPLMLFMPALDYVFLTAELRVQENDAVMTVLALELYRRRNAHWPDTLAELTPDLLPNVPLDRFTGKPLYYRLREGRPLLYSAGTDGDDDGGRPPLEAISVAEEWGASTKLDATTIATAWAVAHDGDWILWPVDQR